MGPRYELVSKRIQSKIDNRIYIIKKISQNSRFLDEYYYSVESFDNEKRQVSIREDELEDFVILD